MTIVELERLANAGHLQREAPLPGEIAGLMHAGRVRLADAQNPSVSLESRFDLGYNSAYSLALAALRRLGLRPDKRYIVFQLLVHTASDVRLLDQCHRERNAWEYQGASAVT